MPLIIRFQIVLLEDYGLDTSTHKSALISEEDIRNAEVVVGVTRNHQRAIQQQFGAELTKGKVTSLDKDVSDPWHAPREVYRACAQQIKPLVEGFLTEYLALAVPGMAPPSLAEAKPKKIQAGETQSVEKKGWTRFKGW
jgi:hypothetical protein